MRWLHVSVVFLWALALAGACGGGAGPGPKDPGGADVGQEATAPETGEGVEPVPDLASEPGREGADEPGCAGCLVDGRCFLEGEGDPEVPCHACITAVATDRLVPDDTLACEDGNGCTAGDRCRAGTCVGGPVDCDDANPCTTDSCEGTVCKHVPTPGAACADGDPCTTGDACGEDGECAGVPLACDDSNDCTTDRCDPAHGCVHEPNAAPCDDGNACTLGDHCQDGGCGPGADRLDCDDGNPCTDDGCVPAAGCVSVPNHAPCEDGDPCTLGDTCGKSACVNGAGVLACDDGNPCTDDACVPFKGCVFTPNDSPCDDGEPCHLDDVCSGGLCVPGPGVPDCDDGNPCTDDSCADGTGCVHADNAAPCDDASVCTEGDTCLGGGCRGTPISCDDEDSCTVDSCDALLGCAHEPDRRPECRPRIVVDYPQRGATLSGDRTVLVSGHVESGEAKYPVGFVTVNGQATLVDPDTQAFQVPLTAVQGMNPVVVDAEDVMYGLSDHVVQSFHFSSAYYAIDDANPRQSEVRDGLMIFLGPQVFDDDDPSDLDDLASVMSFYVKTLDVSGMVHNPVASGEYGWCDYDVNLGTITFNRDDVPIDLVPVDGGLRLKATLKDVRVPFDADLDGLFCDIASTDGDVTVAWITIEATLLISVDADGNPVVQSTDTKVDMAEPHVSVDNFLVRILKDFFLGDLKGQLVDAFESQLGAPLEDAVEEALAGLALDQSFEVPPLMEGGAPVALSMKTRFSSIVFSPAGGALGMYATVVAPRNNPRDVLGSIGRAACLTGSPEPFTFPMTGSLELALHDDLFNQIPFGMWWAGGLHFPVDGAAVGGDLSQYGISDLVLDVEFLLPPILTSCTPGGRLVLQVGDLGIAATLSLFGTPVEMQLYASMEAPARLVAVETPKGRQLSIAVDPPTFLDVEIASVEGGLVGAEDLLGGMIRETLMPKVMEAFTGKALGTFPIPEIDLSNVNPAVPPGSVISIDLKDVLRVFGYNVLSGDVR